jgi:hypothetical protein
MPFPQKRLKLILVLLWIFTKILDFYQHRNSLKSALLVRLEFIWIESLDLYKSEILLSKQHVLGDFVYILLCLVSYHTCINNVTVCTKRPLEEG